MRILLADDSRSTSSIICQFLQQHGHSVTIVCNGLAAIESYLNELPDLVLMDVVMPVMDGIEATRRIKALGGARWVPIMLLTGLSAQEEIVSGLSAGADDYLLKPINFKVLEARIHSMQRIITMQDSLFGIIDNVFEAIITIDEKGTIKSFNKAAERIFGYSSVDVINHNVNLLMPAPYAHEHASYLERYLQDGVPHVIGIGRKVQGRRKNGHTFPMRLSVTEVSQSRGRMFIGLVNDISSEEISRQRIEFLALHDSLTGLPNRAYFNDELERAIVSHGATMCVLYFIDLDGFKPINDNLGHEAGDEALKIIASRLRHNLAANDFAARLGGDEFVALSRSVIDAQAALVIGNRLIAAIHQPMELLGQITQLSASIGIALFPEHGKTAAAIITAADNAMYKAKHAGKNCCVLMS